MNSNLKIFLSKGSRPKQLTATVFGKLLGISLFTITMVQTSTLASEHLEELDRGHRILVQRGLQLQALATGLVGEPQNSDPEILKNWKESGFTTLDIGSTVLPDAPYLFKPKFWSTWIGISNNPANNLPDYIFQRGYDRSLVSWQYKDEQDIGNKEELQQLETWINYYRPLLPNTLLYANQHGDPRFEGFGSANDYNLREYMRRIKPDMLMHDTYPYGVWGDILNQGGRPTQYYFGLARYRRFALAGNDGTGRRPIPYGTWIQTFRGAQYGRFPSESEVSLQQFAALTFGYKLINAFLYNSASDDRVTLESPLFRTPFGKEPTAMHTHLSKVNHQSLILGTALVRLLSTDIRIVPKPFSLTDLVFDGIYQWNDTTDPYITRIQARNIGSAYRGQRGDVLVGYFKPLLESFDGSFQDQQYFMITNGLAGRQHSIDQTRQEITLDFDFGTSGITGLQRLNRKTGQVEQIEAGWTDSITPNSTSRYNSLGHGKYQLKLILDGGSGDLFKFATGAPFVGHDAGL